MRIAGRKNSFANKPYPDSVTNFTSRPIAMHYDKTIQDRNKVGYLLFFFFAALDACGKNNRTSRQVHRITTKPFDILTNTYSRVLRFATDQ